MVIHERLIRLLRRTKDEREGQLFITEILPRFCGRGRVTNKTIWVVNRHLSDDIAEVYDWEIERNKKDTDVSNKRMLTRNGEIYRIKKKENLWKPDAPFEKNGYIEGTEYFFEALGYLGNIDQRKRVVLVLDDYVLFKYARSNSYSLYSYEELERLQPKLI